MTAAAAAAAHQPATQPLPFLGDDIFVLIAAELDARMLGRLACVAQRFWRKSVPDPTHKGRTPPELWSVAEEGARRRLVAQSEQVRGWVSWGGAAGSWLRALGQVEKLQKPLRWTAHFLTMGLSEDGTVAMVEDSYPTTFSAVCGEHEMRRGQHYATFTLRSEGERASKLGVVGPGFDPTHGGSACDSPQGWLLDVGHGTLRHRMTRAPWAGQPTPRTAYGRDAVEEGDVVVRLPLLCPSTPCPSRGSCCAVQGLLLDLDAATLTVWVNGERQGVMVQPSMTDRSGRPVARLEGPLRWAVELGRSSVAIEGPLPPPE